MGKYRPSAFALIRTLFGLFVLFDRILAYSPTIQVPLLDLPILSSEFFLIGIKILFYIAVFCFLTNYRTAAAGLVAGIMHFILLTAYPAHVFSFSYLLPLGCWAFALVEFSGPREKKDLQTPLAILVSSVYLSAGLHKLFHFDLMFTWLSVDLARASHNSIISLCPELGCQLIDFIKYLVVPVEISMGLLFLFARTRRFGFMLAAIFHLILGTLASVKYVGLLMLTLEVALVIASTGWTSRDIKARSFLASLLGIFGALGIILTGLSFLNTQLVLLAEDFAITLLLYFPLLYLGLSASKRASQEDFKHIPTVSKKNLGFALVLLLFGITPTLNHYQKFNQWGWSMFSAAYQENPQIKIEANIPGRSEVPTFYPLIYIQDKANGNMIFTSYDKEYLNRYVIALKNMYPDMTVLTPRP